MSETIKAKDYLASGGKLTTAPNKYRNQKTVFDGKKFDSLKEVNRFGELKIMERRGEIFDILLQQKFPLKINGELICTYIADFVYSTGLGKKITVEDVKSEITRKNPVYRLKKKLMRAIYGIEISEV